MLYAISAFVVFFLLVASGLLLLFYREALGRRIAAIVEPRVGSAPDANTTVSQVADSLGIFAASIQRIVPKGEKETSLVQKRLVRAGFRGENAVNILFACKALLPVLLCVAITASGLYRFNAVIIYPAAIFIGYLVPDYTLDYLIRRRADRIRRGLPDVLDLLVVCLEAGLSLDQAVLRASDELRPSHAEIADELGLAMLEVRAGRPRVDAWRALSERCDSEPVRMMTSILIQADQFGTGISKTFRTHSDTMRTRRRQRTEEAAAKTPIKLVFPLILLLFPSLLVVVLGPAAIMLSEQFIKR